MCGRGNADERPRLGERTGSSLCNEYSSPFQPCLRGLRGTPTGLPRREGIEERDGVLAAVASDMLEVDVVIVRLAPMSLERPKMEPPEPKREGR